MANSLLAWRAQLVSALCLPLAVLLGYMLADPTDPTSMLTLALIIGVLSMPLLMYSYHPLLILCWNAAVAPYFLPGQPFLWMVVAFVGFGFAVLNRFTSPEARFLSVPSVTWSLLALLAIVLATAYLRGGLGFRVFGGGRYGGRAYFYLIASIVGFFALISARIPKHRANLVVGLFFLSGLTALFPNLAYLGGRELNFLFYLFPVSYALEQAAVDFSPVVEYGRLLGATYGSIALYCWLLARYGFRGIFDASKPFRLVLFAAATVGTLACGYRGYMLLFVLTIAAQFVAEKLYQPRILFITGLCALLAAAVAIPMASKLPPVIQRSLAFLPLPLSPSVRLSTDLSSQWRIDMWHDVLPEVPKYLFKGKGYNLDPYEMELTNYSTERGIGTGYSWAIVTGAYHNGPLTLLIPFGIWGFGAFIWFALASIKYLHRNYLYGDPDLKPINTFLLAHFIARLIYYLTAFGNFYTDLFVFTGIVALSISINGTELPAAERSPEVAPVTGREDELAPAGLR